MLPRRATLVAAAGLSIVTMFSGAAPAAIGEELPISEPTIAPPDEPATTQEAGQQTAVAGGVTPLPAGTHRLSGANRYATAAAISSRFNPGVARVYIATGVNYPDALAAAAVAGIEEAPLLLVDTNSIPPEVWSELLRLAPGEILVAGGLATISQSVEDQLATLATVTRFAGANRYETSRLIADQGLLPGTTTFLATGTKFPDALSSAAAAAYLGGRVLLVDGASAAVDQDTLDTMSSLGTTDVRIAGGLASMSEGIAASLAPLPYTRYAGTDRYETGALINGNVFSNPTTVYLAPGTNFPDALAGGALAGATDSPLFIVQNDCIPSPVYDRIEAWDPSTIVLLGGEAVLNANVYNLVECGSAPPPPPPPPPPSNPGDAVDCGDFTTWSQAQGWYLMYFPYYGDVANLDGDDDGIACESLPGAP